MKVGDLLNEDLVFTSFKAKDKAQAIDGLVDRLVALKRLRPDERKTVHSALVAREQVSTTGLGQGIALPHATIDGLDDVITALALAPEGVPFGAADGQPATILFLLLVPRKSIQIHIRTLSGIAHLVHSEEMRRALKSARLPREALDIIRAEESKG